MRRDGASCGFPSESDLMSYASLMVYVEIEGIPEQKVRIASELAKKFGAALIGL